MVTARFRWLLLLLLLPLAALGLGCADPNPTFIFDALPASNDARDGGTADVAGFDVADGNVTDAEDDAEAGSPP